MSRVLVIALALALLAIGVIFVGPSRLRPAVVGTPGALPAAVSANAEVAIMITITRDMAMIDGAAVLAESVRAMRSRFTVDLVAMVHPGITTSRAPLESIGYKIIERPIPLDLNNVPQVYIKEGKAGCCGHYEFLKLEALALTQYSKVLALDVDALIIDNIDELFENDAVFQYTVDEGMDPNDYNSVPPVQGGFLLFSPNMRAYTDLVEIARKADWHQDGTGWGGLKIGYHWGGSTIQGILPYYFGTMAPKHWWKRLDHCVYNYMGIANCTDVAKPLLDIKSAHFTACQKPWECFWEVHAEFQTHHCVYLQSQWWHFRDMFQRRVGKHAPPALKDRCNHTNGKRTYHPLPELVGLL